MFFTPSTSLCLQTNVNVSVNVSVAHLAALLVTTSVVWLRLRHHGGFCSVCIYNKEGRMHHGQCVSHIVQTKLETIFLVTGENLLCGISNLASS